MLKYFSGTAKEYFLFLSFIYTDVYVLFSKLLCRYPAMERFLHKDRVCDCDSVDFQLFLDVPAVIQQANDCLLLRNFEDCLNICKKYIAIAKNYTENER